MVNNNNTYNQPQMPMQPPMPQGGAFVPPQISRRERRRIAEQVIFPKWLSKNALIAYFLALAVVTFMYSTYSIPWYYMLSGVVSMMVFFLYGAKAAQDTSIEKIRREKNFEKRIFKIAFIPRVLFMLLLYTIFMQNYGDSFGFENMDALGYDEIGRYISSLISAGDLHFYDRLSKYTGNSDVADMGYGIYVGFVYWLTDNSILAVRLVKCVWSSLTVVLIYRLAKRNFGEQTARIAAIFCALWPNFWYYCANHLKETEMVFLTVLCIEQADQMLRSRQFTAWKMLPILLRRAALFTFRTVLAMVVILALLFTLVMSSTRIINWGKRIAIGIIAVLLIGITMGNRIEEQTQQLLEQTESNSQKGNMEWRAERKDASGNTQRFAKYAGAAVFAPMIFTLPFSTMVRPFDGQELQQMLNGGYFIKNILSVFTILAMVILLMSGKWREHLLPLSFMLGYLVVLTMSNFAQSDRFHHPVMPFEFMFMAYGLSIAVKKVKYKRWYTYWCGVMFVAAIAWNWFKLKGRGLI